MNQRAGLAADLVSTVLLGVEGPRWMPDWSKQNSALELMVLHTGGGFYWQKRIKMVSREIQKIGVWAVTSELNARIQPSKFANQTFEGPFQFR